MEGNPVSPAGGARMIYHVHQKLQDFHATMSAKTTGK
jgi:hypothetical protein